MKSDFEWQSGDGGHTSQESIETIPSRKNNLSRPVIFLFIVIIIVIGVWLLLRNVGEYVAATENDAEDELRTSLDFLVDAQKQSDLELFAGLLSGRDATWARTQISLAEAGLWLDRRQFGLELLGETSVQDDLVELSADLRQATVTRTFDYRRIDGVEGEEAISLAQVFVFRRGSDRWLLSPPDEEFWGGEEQVQGQFVTAIFPERNSNIHRRLAADFEGTISSTCSIVPGKCQEELHITIIFSRDPEVLFQRRELAAQRSSAGKFLLPAIGLLGVPADESSYRAVYRAYAANIVESLISDHLDATCCAKPVFYNALFNAQLNRLGLRARNHLSPDSLNIAIEQLNGLWNIDSDAEIISEKDRAVIQSFINFLTEDKSPEAIISMQDALFQSDSFWEWLRRFNPVGFESIETLESDWAEFVRDNNN